VGAFGSLGVVSLLLEAANRKALLTNIVLY